MKTLLEELLAGEFEYPTIKDYILKTKSGVTVILANHNTVHIKGIRHDSWLYAWRIRRAIKKGVKKW